MSVEQPVPCLRVSASSLAFLANPTEPSQQQLSVENSGSTSIYYRFKKIQQNTSFQWSFSDPNEKFFCHHQPGVLVPGEKRDFIFSFFSEIEGNFSESWQLDTEPPATIIFNENSVTSPGIFILEGLAVRKDPLKEKRENFDQMILKKQMQRHVDQILRDIIQTVKPASPPLPDFNDITVLKAEWKEKNERKGLHFNELSYKLFRIMEQDLYTTLNLSPDEQFWNLDVEYFKNLIEQVRSLTIACIPGVGIPVSPESAYQFYLQRYQSYCVDCYHPSPEKTISATFFHSMIDQEVDHLPELANDIRIELDMMEGLFYLPCDDEQTNEAKEEAAKLQSDQLAAARAAWLKQTKRKKMTPEDEQQLQTKYQEVFVSRLKDRMKSQFGETEMMNHWIHNKDRFQQIQQINPDFFEKLLHLHRLETVSLENKTILYRVNLPLDLLNPQAKQDYEDILINMYEDQQKNKDTKTKGKGSQSQNPQALQELYENLPFIEQNTLKSLKTSLDTLLERQAKHILLQITYPCPSNQSEKNRLLYSTKFVVEWLKAELQSPILFEKDGLHGDHSDKIDEEFWPEGSIVVFENAGFDDIEKGYRINETEKVRLTRQDRTRSIEKVKALCQTLIFDDIPTFFNASYFSEALRLETNCIGNLLFECLQLPCHMFLQAKRPWIACLGGDLTIEKLLAIPAMLQYCDELYLLGDIGVQIWMVENKKDSFTPYHVDKCIKDSIQVLLTYAENANLRTKLHLPSDFMIAASPQSNPNEAIPRANEGGIDKSSSGATKSKQVIQLEQVTPSLLNSVWLRGAIANSFHWTSPGDDMSNALADHTPSFSLEAVGPDTIRGGQTVILDQQEKKVEGTYAKSSPTIYDGTNQNFDPIDDRASETKHIEIDQLHEYVFLLYGQQTTNHLLHSLQNASTVTIISNIQPQELSYQIQSKAAEASHVENESTEKNEEYKKFQELNDSSLIQTIECLAERQKVKRQVMTQANEFETTDNPLTVFIYGQDFIQKVNEMTIPKGGQAVTGQNSQNVTDSNEKGEVSDEQASAVSQITFTEQDQNDSSDDESSIIKTTIEKIADYQQVDIMPFLLVCQGIRPIQMQTLDQFAKRPPDIDFGFIYDQQMSVSQIDSEISSIEIVE